jgi:hypothetical protein
MVKMDETGTGGTPMFRNGNRGNVGFGESDGLGIISSKNGESPQKNKLLVITMK